jgi:alpha-methylacyl-CoA racemase
MAVGCIETDFYAEFLRILGLTDDPVFVWQMDKERWPEQHRRLEEMFAGRPRDEWAKLFEGSDACTTPVLSMLEASQHPHNQIRGTFRVGPNGTPGADAGRRASTSRRPGRPESEPALGRESRTPCSPRPG